MAESSLLEWAIHHAVAIILAAVVAVVVAVGALLLLARLAAWAIWRVRGILDRGWRWARARWPLRVLLRGRGGRKRRVGPYVYLLIHVAVGLVLAAFAISAFDELAWGVRERDEVRAVDAAVASQITRQVAPAEIGVFGAITSLGSVKAMVTVVAGVTLLLLLRGRRLVAIGWVVTVVGGKLIDVTLKAIVQRPRPQHLFPIIAPTSWSFPSGHAMDAVVLYGTLAYIAVRYGRTGWGGTFAIVAGAAAAILLIGTSRIVLGVHYPSDVLAGYLAGVFWIAVTTSGVEVARELSGEGARRGAGTDARRS